MSCFPPRLLVVSMLLGLCAACGQPGQTTQDVDGVDAGADRVAADTVIGDPDGIPADVAPDTPPPGDVPPDAEGDVVAAACETNEDCPEGVCVPTKYGKQCSTPCLEDCPAGWSCRPLPSGRDDTWACVPDHITTCRPCETHADCQEAGFQPGGICRVFGDLEGSFCATPCGESIDCLTGYVCETLDGGGTYCLPADGVCACDGVAKDQQLSTPCLRENDVGACAGTRVCGAEGLTDCDAPAASVEICDDLDNDCDGATDEGFGGAEVCNGQDDDCDGDIDEKGAEGCTTYYLDKDEDDYGVASASECLCAPAGEYTAVEAGDCDDLEAAANPAADEVCDGVDNDCDGATDPPGIPGTEKFYTDDDGDGYSDGLVSAFLCAASQTHPTQLIGDCDDDDPDVHPGAAEVCDGADNDCDGVVDGAAAAVSCTTNCGAGTQACVGGVLQPCDATPQNACTDFSDCSEYLTCEPCPGPPADDQCDGVDDDCDGATDDEAAGTLLDGTEVIGPGQACGAGACAGGTTECVGGVLVCPTEDLADAETCNDADDDCDGAIDEGLLQAVWYDNDDDDYGDPNVTQDVCVAPDGWVANALDCDDTDPGIHPGAAEVCDGKDNDCNDVADQVTEPCDLGCESGSRLCVAGEWGACDAPSPQSCKNYATCQFEEICVTDCPAPPLETCNGIDDDCDGATDEGLGEVSCGLGPCAHSEPACGNGQPTVCDPLQGATAEVCDGADNDCDGAADDGDPGGGGPCQVPGLQGACAAGVQHCQGGAPVCTQVTWPEAEECNGLDDDCDGAQDDGDPGGGGACLVPGKLGPCAAGVLHCQAGVSVCTQTVFPQTEVCDGVNNDCDDQTDESFPSMGQACMIPALQGECAKGVWQCQGQQEVCAQVNYGTNESCNGLDDDCNGAVDGMSESCTNNCSWGTRTCQGGIWSPCDAPAPACTSGPCCDGCNYRPSSYQCSASPYASDYQCTSGSGCGGQAQKKSQYRYCTGWSSDCGTGNLKWDPVWSILDSCSSSEPCVATGSSAYCAGACGGQCVSGACCGGTNEPCCGGSCNAGNICVSGTCRAEPGAEKTYRYTNLCTSAHWQAKNSGCYPGSTPTTACGGCGSTTTNGCGWSTCWLKEIGFWTYNSKPSWGSFFQIHHCFYSGGNFYSKTSCSAYGTPSTLGWISPSSIATWNTPIYLCNWSASGVSEQFFTFAQSECTNAGGTVASPSPWGYVVP